MDVQSLKYVIAIKELGNFTKAAYECGISQSALSKQIKNIESELGGIDLFNRNERPITLTHAGEDFFQYAQQIIRLYEGLTQSLVKYQTNTHKNLVIGIIPVMGKLGVLPMLANFHQKQSFDKNTKLIDGASSELIDLLKKEQLDAAIVAIPEFKIDPAITCYNLFNCEIVVVANINHPLAQKKFIDLSEILNEEIITESPYQDAYDACIQTALATGYIFKNLSFCRNSESVIDRVTANMGIGVLSMPIATFYKNKDIKIIKLKKPLYYSVSIAINNRRYIKPFLQEFISFAREYDYISS